MLSGQDRSHAPILDSGRPLWRKVACSRTFLSLIPRASVCSVRTRVSHKRLPRIDTFVIGKALSATIDNLAHTIMREHLNGDDAPKLIYTAGTQVVAQKDVMAANDRIAHPAGAVGVIVRSPVDRTHAYRVRFSDGFEAPIHHDQLVQLSEFKASQIRASDSPLMSAGLYERVIYRCVIGSRAYGLDDESSDTDRRGVYLPSAELHWSLYGVPEQLENDETQEVYWELQKFIVLALKANPNVLECLYSPIVEDVTPLGEELLAMKEAFLSKLLFQTFSGYVASQFKKMQTEIRNQGRVKWKHVMHLIRLLLSGTHVLYHRTMIVDVGEHRDRLLTIKRGEMPFADADAWRKKLQREFESAYQATTLPDRPDYEQVNAFLIEARRRATRSELP